MIILRRIFYFFVVVVRTAFVDSADSTSAPINMHVITFAHFLSSWRRTFVFYYQNVSEIKSVLWTFPQKHITCFVWNFQWFLRVWLLCNLHCRTVNEHETNKVWPTELLIWWETQNDFDLGNTSDEFTGKSSENKFKTCYLLCEFF